MNVCMRMVPCVRCYLNALMLLECFKGVQSSPGTALRQHVLHAGAGAAGVQVSGHQDKGGDASKVWVVILGRKPQEGST